MLPALGKPTLFFFYQVMNSVARGMKRNEVKLTDLWIKVIDLNNKLINWSFAFSTG